MNIPGRAYGKLEDVFHCANQQLVEYSIKQHKELGDTETLRKGHCGRKRRTTKRDDAMILRNSVKDPKKTSRDLNRDLLAEECQYATPRFGNAC